MEEYKLSLGESRFAELIWRREPLGSGELVKLCETEFHWKKSTVYTVLKKLCDKGIFQNENSIVSARVKKDAFYAEQSRQFVKDTFGGSLPRFLTAFMGGKKLSEHQARLLKRLIDINTEK